MKNLSLRIKSANSKNGFSLIELSIVLVIVGIFIFGASQLYVITAEKAKVDSTVTTLDAIDRALRLYYKTHKDLPCPADGNLAINDNNFGLGNETNDGTASQACTYDRFYGNAGVASNSVNAYGGVVPTRTLNLPDTYMFDGWGNRITYVVDDNCVNTLASAVASCKLLTASGPDLKVYDNSNNATGTDADDLRTGVATYVIISHGKNGVGAWRRDGGANRIPSVAGTTVPEMENAHVNTTGGLATGGNAPNENFRDDFIRDWKGTETGSGIAGQDGTYFDDMVHWKTQAQLAYED